MHPTPHVLLLEDDPAIARTVCYALERDGIHCTHSLLIADARIDTDGKVLLKLERN